MADLTESEKKMLLELADKYELVSHSRDINHTSLAALSELLLAMKEKAAQIAVNRSPYDKPYDIAIALRNTDFGTLFKEKV